MTRFHLTMLCVVLYALGVVGGSYFMTNWMLSQKPTGLEQSVKRMRKGDRTKAPFSEMAPVPEFVVIGPRRFFNPNDPWECFNAPDDCNRGKE